MTTIVLAAFSNQYDIDERVSVVLWLISRVYVVKNEVTDFTFVMDFTFLTLYFLFICNYLFSLSLINISN